MKDVKVVVFGKENVGKSTLIRAVERDAINIDKKGITVAMDYGRAVVGETKLHLFGTPGQRRFDFMRDILSNGADAGVMVLDSTRGICEDDLQIFREVRRKGIPCLVFSNKSDLAKSHTLPAHLDGHPVIVGSAEHGHGVGVLLQSLAGLAMTVCESEARPLL